MSFALLLIGCREEVDAPNGLEISLCMPVGELMPARQRAMGDPGLTEHFELPKYAYIFVTKQDGADYIVWHKDRIELNEANWEYTRYYGSLAYEGDSIFRYTTSINYLLNNDQPTGNVYAICSNVELTFDQAFNNITTQEHVLNLKFNAADDPADDTDGDIQQNLQNIYSTPYNYTIGSKYYCSYVCASTTVTRVNMMLYHIASKVDLKWNVADSVRIKPNPADAVRLTYLGAQNLFNGWAYAFKPMENILPEMPTSGYNRPNLVNNDEGLWWEGRTYFYAIPYRVSGQPDYLPLQLQMCTNGDNKDTQSYRLTLQQPYNNNSPFVPWLRGNIVLTKPLADKAETKTTND